MAITIGRNIAALRSARALGVATKQLSETTERIASGMRINKASDDPAALALAATLRADSRLAATAIRNSNDAISLLSIKDSALAEVSIILMRMAELSEQAANGVYTNRQRSAIQAEFLALGSEIERIAVTTQFNQIKLLSGSQSITIQVGFDAGSHSQIQLQAVSGTLHGIKLAAANSSVMLYSTIGLTEIESQAAARTALAAVMEAIDVVGSQRGMIGASESRLEVAVRNLETVRENFIEAESRIRDTDVVQEAANLVRQQILQQTAAAILAQANLQPKRALDLLHG